MDRISPSLPTEIIAMVIKASSREALLAIMRASLMTYNLGCKVLYTAIMHQLSKRQCILLLKTLSTPVSSRLPTLPHPSTFVRILSLDFTANSVTSNLLRLVHRALLSLSSLYLLSLELSFHDSLSNTGWVLDDVPASLGLLHTSLAYDQSLARFLETQPRIEALMLRGYRERDSDTVFTLSSNALPSLEILTVLDSRTQLLRTLIAGRALKILLISFHREDEETQYTSQLSLLKPVADSLLYLIIFQMDDNVIAQLEAVFQSIATTLPNLRGIQLKGCDTSYDLNKLMVATVYLEQMRKLAFIEIYLTTEEAQNDSESTLDNERRIVDVWSKACPTLCSISFTTYRGWRKEKDTWYVCNQRGGMLRQSLDGMSSYLRQDW